MEASNKKILWLILFFVILLTVIFSAVYVFGAISGTQVTPTANGTEYYNSCPFTINVTRNESYERKFTVQIWANSSANQGKPVFKALYANGSTVTGGYAWNSSALCWGGAGTPSGTVLGPAPFYLPERWMQIIINETVNASTGPPGVQNYTTINKTVNGGTQFYINERQPGSITITPYRVKDGVWYPIANNSIFQYADLNISIITDKTIAYCQDYNVSNSTLMGIISEGVSMTPANSSSRTMFNPYYSEVWSSSDFNGTSHQLSWACSDAFGNQTWYNTSATGGFLNFKTDLDAPSLNDTRFNILNSTQWQENSTATETLYFSANGSYASLAHGDAWAVLVAQNLTHNFKTTNFTIAADKSRIQLTESGEITTPESLNVTYSYRGKYIVSATQGNYINFTFEVTDKNINSGWVKIFKPDGTAITLIGTRGAGIKEAAYYSVNITPQYLDKNGIYRIQPMANDLAGNQGNSTANTSVIVSNLLANRWNAVVFYENITLAQIAGRTLNVTYVSYFNNLAGYKNFTTYQVGLATGGGMKINQSEAVLMYPSENAVIIRQIYNSTSDIIPTINLTTGGWNFIAMDANFNATVWNQLLGQRRFSLNESMYADACANNTVTVVNRTGQTVTNNTAFRLTDTGSSRIWMVIQLSNGTYKNDTSVQMVWNSTHVTMTEIGQDEIDWTQPFNITFSHREWNIPASNCANVTYTSYFNASNNYWYSAKRGMGINALTYPPLDQGFWILTSVNMSFDREAVGWYDARTS